MTMPPILLSREQIDQRVTVLAAEITRDYADRGGVHMVGVLKGAFVFMADLVRRLDLPVTIDFLALELRRPEPRPLAK